MHNTLNELSNCMADAVEQVGPALVMVDARQRQAASGLVYGNDLVLTADHVIEREDRIKVQTADGRSLAAQFVGRDPASDLALLRVAGLGQSAAQVAGEPARVGQLILAVGRPSTGGPMASLGIVSAAGGPLRTARGTMLERYIQTDATPYPGFSGGPLIDGSGTVLGVLTTGLVPGIALAVPAEIAWRIAGMLAQQGHIKRGYLGISSQPVLLPEGQRAGRKQERGLLVVQVEPNSPAAGGGLMLGDIVVGMAGQVITDTDELQALLGGDRVGNAVPIDVIRGGSLQTLQVNVGQRP
jgi:S1-C subfamily serine protease